MTDISDLREGDEIEVVLRLTVGGGHRAVCVSRDGGRPFYLDQVAHIAESVTVVRPEIIRGKYYTDDHANFYYGYEASSGTGVCDINGNLYGIVTPLPHGLRPAKVVPES